MSILINELKTIYDFIVIDTPPIAFVADAFTIVKDVDAYIFVMRQNFTLKKAIENINDIQKNINIPNLSILINGVKYETAKYGHNYGYGYGYGYGSGYGYGYHEDDEMENAKKSKKEKGFFSKIFRS